MTKLKPPKKTKYTIREKKFIASKIKGNTNAKAYAEAGYKLSTRQSNDVNSSKLLNKPKIQDAIQSALEHHEATPEFAVGVLKQVADQQDEIGARRLAAKDILELHGWKRGEQPNITLDIKNASFFNQSRTTEIIEQD